jgi:ssRNA-specific RNase YbeY (16S rRNA maturation enzyme)
LHLCGWDDATAAERSAMQRREDELLSRCGRGPAPRDEG